MPLGGASYWKFFFCICSGSLFTNSNWFAFEDDRVSNERAAGSLASPSPNTEETGATNGGADDDQVIVSENDDLDDTATSAAAVLEKNLEDTDVGNLPKDSEETESSATEEPPAQVELRESPDSSNPPAGADEPVGMPNGELQDQGGNSDSVAPDPEPSPSSSDTTNANITVTGEPSQSIDENPSSNPSEPSQSGNGNSSPDPTPTEVVQTATETEGTPGVTKDDKDVVKEEGSPEVSREDKDVVKETAGNWCKFPRIGLIGLTKDFTKYQSGFEDEIKRLPVDLVTLQLEASVHVPCHIVVGSKKAWLMILFSPWEILSFYCVSHPTNLGRKKGEGKSRFWFANIF